MDINLEELGSFTKEIVHEAGQLLLKLKEEPLELEEKKSHSDLVTIVDGKIEKFLIDKILEKYPNHGIVGEEGVFDKDLENYDTLWVIDPIDGTTNFIHDFPYYGISIGIVHKGEGIIGTVYNPSKKELYYGEKDKGAYLNEKRIELNNEIEFKEALVSTTMFWEDVKTKDSVHPSIIQIYKDTRGLRMVGGAAISLCEVAKGTLNAYIMPMLNTWDYAGGVIILKEAGGIVTQVNGNPISFEKNSGLIASHPKIHKELVNRFN